MNLCMVANEMHIIYKSACSKGTLLGLCHRMVFIDHGFFYSQAFMLGRYYPSLVRSLWNKNWWCYFLHKHNSGSQGHNTFVSDLEIVLDQRSPCCNIQVYYTAVNAHRHVAL